jgi:hypothetical protein
VAYDERQAERVRAVLANRSDADERKMFGGVAYLISGNMACGVMHDDLMVRLERDEAAELIAKEPGISPFDMTGRPMRNWIVVASERIADDAALAEWVERGVRFAASLPPK